MFADEPDGEENCKRDENVESQVVPANEIRCFVWVVLKVTPPFPRNSRPPISRKRVRVDTSNIGWRNAGANLLGRDIRPDDPARDKHQHNGRREMDLNAHAARRFGHGNLYTARSSTERSAVEALF